MVATRYGLNLPTELLLFPRTLSCTFYIRFKAWFFAILNSGALLNRSVRWHYIKLEILE